MLERWDPERVRLRNVQTWNNFSVYLAFTQGQPLAQLLYTQQPVEPEINPGR